MACFDAFFAQALGGGTKRHDWQARLALDSVCRNQLIRIPTGFGKTAGVTIAWLWNRMHQGNDDWPRRIVLCLPMRTLVEQTERAVKEWIEHTDFAREVGVHVLLGGLSPSDWHLEPDRNAVLIGTQDMLLSRALNRGYGSGRARWPMEHGLLNVDCLWVMDEIQLMDVGLATSAQLQAFASADEHDGKLPRPRRTWWMSATLQRKWLRRAPALTDVNLLPILHLEPPEQTGPLWTVEKGIRVEHVPAVDDAKGQAWAEMVASAHGAIHGGITLAVANTVRSARDLHTALARLRKNDPTLEGVDLRLVHSRFRGAERRQWATEFLSREHCKPGSNRIIVATQVVEAGVDISADLLITELAPWASLVQRFGRCARYGGTGQIIVVDRRHSDESASRINAKDDEERSSKRADADRKTALPYELGEVNAAGKAIILLKGAAGPVALDEFEKSEEEKKEESLLPRLYPYTPLHILTRRELLDLFDTGPDLTGADIDISRFVREGDDRDLTVWWWPVPERQSPRLRLRPAHDALCRVPVGEARSWLVAGGERSPEGGEPEVEKSALGDQKTRSRAWVWSYLDGNWERLEDRHIFPGQTILVEASAGGYDVQIGFTGKPSSVPVEYGHARAMSASDAVDQADEQEELSEGLSASDRQYKTIATHGAEVAIEGQKIAAALIPNDVSTQKLMALAGIVHDIGKGHAAFVGAIRDRNGIELYTALAKAPKGRWHGLPNLYDHSHVGKRPGFRHELASALAILEFVWRAHPAHPALHGGREDVLDATVGRELPDIEDRILQPLGVLADLIGLDENALNLVLYLVQCHHGKVRATLPMSPRDQENTGKDGSLPLRGVRGGDEIPALLLADTAQNEFEFPRVSLCLDPARLGLSKRYGPSWVERVLALRHHYGGFQLAWLEALFRVADVRASQISRPLDPRLSQDLVEVQTTPETPDRDADLRNWIKQTVDASASGPASPSVREKAKGHAAPSASTKRSRRGAS